MAYCRNCGTQISDTAAFCSQCGCAVSTMNNNYNSPFMNNQYNPYPNAPVKNGMATASMVLGILGVLFLSEPILSLPLNIIGLVLAVQSRKVSRSGKGTAGLVLSIIGLSLLALSLIIKITSPLPFK